MLRQILFLCIPSVVMIHVLIYATSDYFPLLNKNQTLYFSAGIILSCLFHSYKFRLLPWFTALLLVFGAVNLVLDNFALGEFDSFFISMEFMLFRFMFVLGWICGWGFARSKYFPAVFSALLLIFGIVVTSLSGKSTVSELINSFAPVPVFAFYIIFMNELLRNTDEDQSRSWIIPVKGLMLYLSAMALLLYLSFNVFKTEIENLTVKWEQEATVDGDYGHNMYDVLPDSTLKLKKAMSVTDRLERGDGDSQNTLLFVAYIDNFFPMSDIPNPLYLVSSYLSVFDNETETFESDSALFDNAPFSPDPSRIPLYFTETDSTLLHAENSLKHKKIVETEIYKIKLSETEFTAPATSFHCRPIAVRNELDSRYTSAYRAKSLVSELNSAYFVYNNVGNDWELEAFQEERFELLRKISNFDEVDAEFMNYYTEYPKNNAYDTVRRIALKIVEEADAETPIDKILAIRNHFAQTDEFGVPMFRYSNVATTLPPGSRILNFLLNEHTGNCTYYAGSTFLLLRACGIPTRIATGYAVVDRSSNNKGWYWIYTKQAHAWVQVFFPEYGWLDFDTTFGDSDGSEAPATDGTPPLDPQKAWFVASGEIAGIDTVKQSVHFMADKLVCFDKEYKPDVPQKLRLDLSLATLMRDSLHIKIGDLRPGEKGLALSFTQTDDVREEKLSGSLERIMLNLPFLIPTDQLRLKGKKDEPAETKNDENEKSDDKPNVLLIVLMTTLIFVVLSLGMAFSIPVIIFRQYSRRAKRIKNPDEEAFYAYRAAMFLLHQMGYLRHNLTPLQYADKMIDREFGTAFGTFIATYLKVKYARQKLTSEDSQRILSFYKPFEHTVKAKIGFKQYFLRFLNIYNTLEYFTRQKQ